MKKRRCARGRAAAFVAVLVAAAPTLGARATPPVLRSGPPGCHGIALTFDLCPVAHGSGFDEPLVHALVAHRIHSTFFPSGRWMATHDAAVRELLAVPFFELGTHGETHRSLAGLPQKIQRDEIVAPARRLADYGRATHLFRPPSGDFDADTLAAADDAALRVVLWSVVSGDPDPALPASRIASEVERRARDGSIIVFHANGRGWHTAEVIEDVYRTLVVGRGFAPLTVSELLAGCGAR